MPQQLAGFLRRCSPRSIFPKCRSPHDPEDKGVFRRYFYSHSAAASSLKIRFFPTREKLLEKLRGKDVARKRIRLDDMRPPVVEESGKETVADARKIFLLSQLEMVKSRLRQIEKNCVSYPEFLQICVKGASNEEQGIEFSKLLDKSLFNLEFF